MLTSRRATSAPSISSARKGIRSSHRLSLTVHRIVCRHKVISRICMNRLSSLAYLNAVLYHSPCNTLPYLIICTYYLLYV
uniref:Uncharacterized protein n=1 Tax=Triticum urartu TaxID=4572 RepID=A0A8R7QYJ6_TRIUA